MGIAEILGLLAAAAAGWFVWDSLKAREAANAAMRVACKTAGVLFLDDTVALQSLWAVRNHDGHLRLRRVYHFEYSDTGDNRRRGSITMVAETVSALNIDVRTEGAMLH